MELAKECGYDFVEYSVRDLDVLSDGEVSVFEEQCGRLDMRVEAMNCMLPQRLQVTGANVDLGEVKKYLVKNAARAGRLGCETIVFGSAWSRDMPEGFSDKKKAFAQLVEYLHIAADICGEHSVTIAIEPLHGTNIISYISEGHYLTHLANRTNVQLLGDIYAMVLNHESCADIVTYSEHMVHLHFCSHDRKYPKMNDAFDYAPFFEAVKRSGYNKRISIEASVSDDMRKDYLDAMSVFKHYL
jgi:sugar phosphate isomerase/epimerase